MKNEIKVNEFVRTKDGYIGKYIKDGLRKGTIEVEDNMVSWIVDGSNILKRSKNLIDLIECGDYVNGYKVISIDRDVTDIHTQCIELDLNNNYQYNFITINQIETIVTKEQMAQISYKVERNN